MNRICVGCDNIFREDDTAPVQRNIDGTVSNACRKCISKWIKEGWLKAQFPFWARKQGLDQ